jgi:hypothetical protein
MELPNTEQTILDRGDDEQIDVLRIRLWNSEHVTALLGEFHTAERVLANWAEKLECSPVRFEIVFVDGYVVEGAHEFFKKGRRRCLLSTHVRKLLGANSGVAGHISPSPGSPLLRYCITT